MNHHFLIVVVIVHHLVTPFICFRILICLNQQEYLKNRCFDSQRSSTSELKSRTKEAQYKVQTPTMEADEPVFENQTAEIVYLRAQLANERAARIQLDDELDLLAWDNDRLRNLVAALPKSSSPVPVKPAASTETTDISVVDVVEEVPDEFLVEGNGKYANKVVARINNACGGMNALCVAFCLLPTTNDHTHMEGSWAMACGGVDKIFRVYSVPWLMGSVNIPNHSSTVTTKNDDDNDNNQLMFTCPLSAPILAMAVHGSLVACALMDGGLAVVCILLLFVTMTSLSHLTPFF